MEEKGIQTCGDYNREVEAYNETVIDLAKYREAKRQLEQEKVHQEKQQTKAERLFTPAERTQLQSAEKFLKTEPTFEAINKRLGQLSRFEDKVKRDYQALEQKDQDFQKIKDHLFGLSSSQNRIKEYQAKVDSIGIFKGLSKQNKKTKEMEENEIQRHESIRQI